MSGFKKKTLSQNNTEPIFRLSTLNKLSDHKYLSLLCSLDNHAKKKKKKVSSIVQEDMWHTDVWCCLGGPTVFLDLIIQCVD